MATSASNNTYWHSARENEYVPLLLSIGGKTFPLKHTRNYVERVKSGAGTRAGVGPASEARAPSSAPVVLLGNANEVDWDFFSEMEFRDELHFQQFFAIINEQEAADKLAEAEERFSVPEKLRIVVLGETCVTTGG
jgi:hypothetical protein